MKSILLTTFLLFIMRPLSAIGDYQPGDTLYVWAESGLILREGSSTNSAKMALIPYGTALVVQNYAGEHATMVQALPEFKIGDENNPAVMLGGDFAQVTFKGKAGYLFDGYLSKLPPFRYVTDKAIKASYPESFIDWATRNFGLLQKTQRGVFEYGSFSSFKYIFGNGIMLDSWGEKDGNSRTILPDVSMEEAFLMFNFMTNYVKTVQIQRNVPEDYPWHFSMPDKNEWYFSSFGCDYNIRYLPNEKLALITSHCSC